MSERPIQSQRSAALHLVGVVVASMGALFLVWEDQILGSVLGPKLWVVRIR